MLQKYTTKIYVKNSAKIEKHHLNRRFICKLRNRKVFVVFKCGQKYV